MSYTVVIPSGNQNNLTACLARFKARRVAIIRDVPFSFPKAVNAGIRAADPQDDIVLMSDDVFLINPDGLDLMEKFSQTHPEFGLISSCVETGPIVNPEQRPRNGASWWEVLNPMVATACVYIPRKTINLIGGLDESYTGYGWDDDDYCASVRQAGLRIAVCGACRVEHSHTLQSMYRTNFDNIKLEALSKINRGHFEKKWKTVWTPSNKMPTPKQYTVQDAEQARIFAPKGFSVQTHDVVQSLWIGDKIDTHGQLTMKSFMAAGHPFHLYAFKEPANVPEGVKLLPASHIIDEAYVKKFRFVAQLADWFRYNMLLAKGGWWVDLDTVCLKPFDFPEPIVLSRADEPTLIVPNSPMKAPAGSDFLKWLIQEAGRKTWKAMEWSEIGPTLMTKAVKEFKIGLQPPIVFNPIPPGREREGIMKFIDPKGFPIDPATYAVHLHHSRWTIFDNQDVEAKYPETCLYEKWKRLFGVRTFSTKDFSNGIVDRNPVVAGAWVWRDGKKIQLDLKGNIING